MAEAIFNSSTWMLNLTLFIIHFCFENEVDFVVKFRDVWGY